MNTKKVLIFALLLTLASHFGASNKELAINTQWDDYIIDQFHVIEDIKNV